MWDTVKKGAVWALKGVVVLGAVVGASLFWSGGKDAGWWGASSADSAAAKEVNELGGRVAEHEAKLEASATKVAEVEKTLGDHALSLQQHAETLKEFESLKARVARLEAAGYITAEQAKNLLSAANSASAPQAPVAAPVPTPAPAAPAASAASSNVATKSAGEAVATKIDSANRRIDRVVEVVVADRKVIGEAFAAIAKGEKAPAKRPTRPAVKSAADAADYFRDNSGPSDPRYFQDTSGPTDPRYFQ